MKNKFTWISFFMSFMLVMNVVANSYLPKRISKLEIRNEQSVKKTKKVLPEKYGKITPAAPLSCMAKADDSEEKVILSEDFSKFTAGSETTPDATDITDPQSGAISSNYTQTPGWGGGGIFQAGGAAYFGLYTDADGENTGFMDSPAVDLSGNGGTFTVSFRARSTSAQGDGVYIIWVNTKTDKYDGASVMITNEWANYSYTFKGVGTEDMLVEIYPIETPAYFDDIKFSQPDNGIDAPKVKYPTNITATGFTANWGAVAKATSYLLNVYSYEAKSTGVEETTVTEGFDRIAVRDKKFIDEENSVFPEGWTIDVMTNGTSRHVYNTTGNYQSASISIAFDATGDKIETPVTSAPIKEFSFWVKNQDGDETSYITVEGFNGTSWETMGMLSPSNLSVDGQVVGMDGEDIPAGIVQLRISYTKGKGNCSLDDISYTYGGDITVKKYVLEGKETTETSYAVTGLTEGVEYYYTVQAKNAKYTSEESREMKAAEVLKELAIPVVKDATNVSDAGFTANWEPVENADGYAAYALLSHKASADEQYYLMNENFNRIDFGTMDDPEYGGSGEYLDNYISRPDWLAYWPVYAEGVIGVDNSFSMLGIPGVLFSPNYDLSKDGGKVRISFRARGTGVSSVVISLYQGDDQKPLSSQSKAVTDSWSTLTFDMTGGKENTYISIMVKEGDGIMFIDDLKVSQNLKAGESVDYLHYAYMETLNTSQAFSTPDKVDGDTFSFMVSAFAFYENEEGKREGIKSEYSEPKLVKGDTSVDAAENNGTKVYVTDDLHVELDAPALVAVYTANGVCIHSLEAQEGNTVIRLMEKGVYLVRVGDKMFRVVK